MTHHVQRVMPGYTIETRGDARELYLVEADSPEEARLKFEAGEAVEYLTEVTGAEVVDVREGDD